MIYKVKLKDFLKIADIALTRQQACCNIVITKKSHLAVTIRIIWGGAEVRIFCVSAYEQCLTDGVRAEILNRGRNI